MFAKPVTAADITGRIKEAGKGCKEAVSFVSKYTRQINEIANNDIALNEIQSEIRELKPKLVEYSKKMSKENVTQLVGSILKQFQTIFDIMKQNFPNKYFSLKNHAQQKQRTDTLSVNELLNEIEIQLNLKKSYFETSIAIGCGYEGSGLFRDISETIATFADPQRQLTPIQVLKPFIEDLNRIRYSPIASSPNFWKYYQSLFPNEFLDSRFHPLISANSYSENVAQLLRTTHYSTSNHALLLNDSNEIVERITKTRLFRHMKQNNCESDICVDVIKHNKHSIITNLLIDQCNESLKNNLINAFKHGLNNLANREDTVAMQYIRTHAQYIDEKITKTLLLNSSPASIQLMMELNQLHKEFMESLIKHIQTNDPEIIQQVIQVMDLHNQNDPHNLYHLNALNNEFIVDFLIQYPQFVKESFFKYNKSAKVLDFLKIHILNKYNLSDQEYYYLCLAVVNNPYLSVSADSQMKTALENV